MEIGRMDQKQNKENNFLTERRVDAEAVHTHRRIAGAWASYVIRLSVALLCILAASLTTSVPAHAENASITYGSSEYTPIEDGEFQIGLYIQCDAPDFVYTVTMQYDPARMEYLGGADTGGGGTLQFAGNGSGGERRYMLTFRALSEGDCQVSVTEASVITSPQDAGEGAEADGSAGNAAEAVPVVADITFLGSAAVRIQPSVDCTLSSLSIEGVPAFAFEPDIYTYEIEVPFDMEELRLEAVANDDRATVDVSDTSLAVGENVVTVTVHSDTENVQYALHITRMEQQSDAAVMETTLGGGQAETQVSEADMPASDTAYEGEEESARQETAGEAASTPDVAEAMARGAERETGNVTLSGGAVLRYLIWGGGMLLLIAAGTLGFFLWKRTREERYFDEDDEEEEWLDLSVDEKWLSWLEEVEDAEEEMEDKASPQPAEPVPKATEPAQSPAVIRIEDVSMRFKINEVNAGSLKEYLLAAIKRQNRYHELEALQHISFDIQKGEVVGIIGTNGSGKSTLLKLIAGVLYPSEGRIEVDRRKVQLLTLGTGFDSELTARENVYLNGAIIGYSKEFIDAHYDKIVEFAELEGFMDEKIKNFSSGMTSRLGFAIATAGETAEILILDEVLSVGDMFFRKKSEQRIKEMIHSGSTVLIVSHSTDTIIKNCTKAVWIEKGVLKEIGEPKKVCEAYRKMAV